MILFRKFCFLSFGLFFLSISVYATQTTNNPVDISSVKTSPLKKIFPKAYSSIMLRNYQDKEAVTGKNFESKFQTRYTLGSTFFNDRFDISVVFGVTKEENSTVLKDRGTRIESLFKLYGNDYYNAYALGEVHFPGTGKSKISTILGGYQEIGYKDKKKYLGIYSFFNYRTQIY